MAAVVMRPRSEVPEEETWRLEDIFPNDAAWEQALSELKRQVEAPKRYLGHLGDSAGVLADFEEAFEELRNRVDRVGSYAHFRLATDGGNPANQAAAGRVQPIYSEVQSIAAAARSELLRLPAGTAERYLAAEPRLADFRQSLEQILKDSAHALEPQTEHALAVMNEVSGDQDTMFSRVTQADLRFEPAQAADGHMAPVSLSEFMFNIEMGPDTTLRRNAWKSLTEGLSRYENTLATNLAASIRGNVLVARLRGYGSALEMMLESGWMMGEPFGPSLENFHSVLDTFENEYAPVARRYARLKKRALDLDKMLLCDVQSSPVSDDLELDFAKAAKWIVEAAGIMGPDYQHIMERAFEERWIDRAINEGRTGGAFCGGVHGIHPYVFSSWSGAVRSLFMLAHELGHAAHFDFSTRNQRPSIAHANIYGIEGPSTFNELILADHLLSTSQDPALKRQVIISLLSTYHHNFITHLLEAELLRRLYEISEKDQPLTAKVIGDNSEELLAKFWGDEVEMDKGARLNWMRQPHYYMGVYPFTYSVGLSGATAAAVRLQAGETAIAEKWVEMLKAGGSMGPRELFRIVGVELGTPETIRSAIAYADGLVDKLETLL